jgi:hypothetical protein
MYWNDHEPAHFDAACGARRADLGYGAAGLLAATELERGSVAASVGARRPDGILALLGEVTDTGEPRSHAVEPRAVVAVATVGRGIVSPRCSSVSSDSLILWLPPAAQR